MVNKQRAFALMQEFGIETAIVEFAGGEDSGGVDNILFKDKDGHDLAIGEQVWEQEWDQAAGRYIDKTIDEQQKKINELHELLSAPVYDTYYSFAFEGYVDGKVVWTASTRSCEMTTQEERRYYEDVVQTF